MSMEDGLQFRLDVNTHPAVSALREAFDGSAAVLGEYRTGTLPWRCRHMWTVELDPYSGLSLSGFALTGAGARFAAWRRRRLLTPGRR